MMTIKSLSFVLVVAVCLSVSCSKDKGTEPRQEIPFGTLTPASGPPGTIITISNVEVPSPPQELQVEFGDHRLPVPTMVNSNVMVACPNLSPGVYKIYLAHPSAERTLVASFTLTASPSTGVPPGTVAKRLVTCFINVSDALSVVVESLKTDGAITQSESDSAEATLIRIEDMMRATMELVNDLPDSENVVLDQVLQGAGLGALSGQGSQLETTPFDVEALRGFLATGGEYKVFNGLVLGDDISFALSALKAALTVVNIASVVGTLGLSVPANVALTTVTFEVNLLDNLIDGFFPTDLYEVQMEIAPPNGTVLRVGETAAILCSGSFKTQGTPIGATLKSFIQGAFFFLSIDSMDALVASIVGKIGVGAVEDIVARNRPITLDIPVEVPLSYYHQTSEQFLQLFSDALSGMFPGLVIINVLKCANVSLPSLGVNPLIINSNLVTVSDDWSSLTANQAGTVDPRQITLTTWVCNPMCEGSGSWWWSWICLGIELPEFLPETAYVNKPTIVVVSDDTTPPAAVADLAAGSPTATSMTLTSTAPGDDGNVGTASQYDIRYSMSTINESNWGSATQCTAVPKPKAAGSAETFVVTGLTPSTKYYFGLKTADEKPNWSGLSNIVSGTTQAAEDKTSPAAVADLAAINPTLSSAMLTWTVPGDDGDVGIASQYDIRYSISRINESSWSSATQCTGEPTPRLAGSSDTFIVTALSPNTKYYFGLKTADEKPNWSAISNVPSNSTLCNTGSWTALGAGMNGPIWAFAEYNGQLIAGGQFTTAGGVSANNIAAWDGSLWSPLGTGLNDDVFALTVYDGQLIAGGWFTTAGGAPANYIAAWNGSAWSPLGTGLVGGYEPFVLALTVYDSQLIAGGGFSTAGAVSANHIAAWDGSSWSSLGVGRSYAVWALSVYNGQLVAGGGEYSGNNIAVWNGSTWSSLGTGLSHHISALTMYSGQLVAGGDFRAAPWIEGRIDTWNGSSWSALGGNLDGRVHALAVYNDQLIVGGGFNIAGSVSANNVVVWNGSSWSPLCAGLNSAVLTLTILNDQLVAGGSFTAAGSVPANFIAAWK